MFCVNRTSIKRPPSVSCHLSPGNDKISGSPGNNKISLVNYYFYQNTLVTQLILIQQDYNEIC